MKNWQTAVISLSLTLTLAACNDFLSSEPMGVVYDEQLNTEEGIEALVIATYAMLGNDHWGRPHTTMWPYGNVRADDAYKGGSGTGDQGGYNNMEQFVFMTPTGAGTQHNNIWTTLYVGIGRANNALARLAEIPDAEFSDKSVRQAEVRFIRGHFYFLLKILFNRVPYIDETVPTLEYEAISNVALTSEELWERIAADFQFAMDNLPAAQPERGRVDRLAAAAYLAKVQLYRAYLQDENHRVTGIDQSRLGQVVNLTDAVISSGRFALTADFAENFLWETEANSEAVFSIMMSVNDGTPRGRLDMGNGLNYPMVYGCCWFHIPSQNLVNAFQTDTNGLPLFEAFNQTSLTDSLHFLVNGIDPRLDHTIGIPTHPYKYDPNFIYRIDWARAPQVYGPYSSMKPLQHIDCACLKAWGPFWGTSKDVVVIRYADVLLWKAEALIELGRHAEALPLINQVRQRAADSTNRLKYADGSPVSNYRISPYPVSGWTQAYAREALRWERRLELALEGQRFFDLVRWGIAEETLNDYFSVERTRRGYLSQARFTQGRDEYLPIPQAQVDLSRGLYQQNPGY